MKKIMFLLCILLLFSIGYAEEFATGHDWWVSWGQDYPEYFCGAWVDGDNEDCMVIGIIDKKYKKEILDSITDKSSVKFKVQKYSYSYLYSICEECLQVEGVNGAGVSDYYNRADIYIELYMPFSERLAAAEKLYRKYGSKITVRFDHWHLDVGRVDESAEPGPDKSAFMMKLETWLIDILAVRRWYVTLFAAVILLLIIALPVRVVVKKKRQKRNPSGNKSC